MRRISSPNVLNAFIALVGISAIAVSTGIEVRAEDCLAAPNAASPAGQHWYYRIDRVKQRKCWYLHAPQRVAHQVHSAAVAADADHPAPVAPVPFAAPPFPAASVPLPVPDLPMVESAPVTDNTPNQPQVTALAVKTIVVRPPGAPVETRSQHRAREASIQQASAQTYRAAPESKSAPTIFFFLVFGLGLVTFLTAIVIKHVAPQLSWPVRPSGVARMERSAIREWQ